MMATALGLGSKRRTEQTSNLGPELIGRWRGNGIRRVLYLCGQCVVAHGHCCDTCNYCQRAVPLGQLRRDSWARRCEQSQQCNCRSAVPIEGPIRHGAGGWLWGSIGAALFGVGDDGVWMDLDGLRWVWGVPEWV